MTLKLPIHTKGITFMEIPNKMVAFFEVGNCQMKCKGCHSQHLWADKGATLMSTEDFLHYADDEYVEGILFMGGFTNGVNPQDVVDKIIKPLSVYYPIGMYHGGNTIDTKYTQYFEWMKIGSFVESLGGLDKLTTNQRFFQRNALGQFEDCTKLFQSNREEW